MKPKPRPTKKPGVRRRSRRPLDLITSSELSPQMQVFVDNYISNGWNGTRAALAAGYSAGKNNASAAVQSSHLLNQPKIKAAIKAALERHTLGREHVLARLSEIANSSIANFTDDSGVVDWKKVQERGHLVKKRELTTSVRGDGAGGQVEVENCKLELHDPLRALELVGKFHKLFTDRVETDPGAGAGLGLDLQSVPLEKLLALKDALAALRTPPDSSCAPAATAPQSPSSQPKP